MFKNRIYLNKHERTIEHARVKPRFAPGSSENRNFPLFLFSLRFPAGRYNRRRNVVDPENRNATAVVFAFSVVRESARTTKPY